MDPFTAMRGFEQYWKHWAAVENWRQNYYYNSTQISGSNMCLHYLPNYHESNIGRANPYSNENYNNSGYPYHDNCEPVTLFHRYNKEEMVVPNNDDDDDDEEEEEDDVVVIDDDEDDGEEDEKERGDDLEFVVNEEMIAFFEQSIRHKMELQRQRNLLNNNGSSSETESQSARNKTISNKHRTRTKKTVLEDTRKTNKKGKDNSKKKSKKIVFTPEFRVPVPNTNVDGQKRTDEMKLLYGDAAPKICGMETAMQLTFNRLKDRSKPIYWPCIPFNP